MSRRANGNAFTTKLLTNRRPTDRRTNGSSKKLIIVVGVGVVSMRINQLFKGIGDRRTDGNSDRRRMMREARRKLTIGDWSVPLSVRLNGSTHTGV